MEIKENEGSNIKNQDAQASNHGGKTVLIVAVITIAARLLTLFSTQLYMSFYGADSREINIYSIAVNIPNQIFTAVGTSLTTVVIPIYISQYGKDKKRADAFINDIITIVSLLALILIAAGSLLAPLLGMLNVYDNDAENASYLVFAVRVMLPVILFYSLNFIFQGLLQARGKFLMPAAVTLPSSLAVILYIIFFGNKFGVTGLLVATLLGLSFQAVFLVPAVLKLGYRFRPSFNFKSEDVKKSFMLALPAIAAASAFQLNMFFNNMVALNHDKATIMNYVQNILLVSVLTFIYSVTAVYYPKLTRLWDSGSRDEYKKTLSSIIGVVMFLLIPVMLGFVLVRYDLFDLISRWGKFDAAAVSASAALFGIYAFAVPALGLKEILDRGFYAQKNPKISAVTGFIIMGINIPLCLLLTSLIGINGLAVSYAISGSIGVLFLLIIMRKRIGGFLSPILPDLIKSLIAALVMAAVVFAEQGILNTVITSDGLAARFLRLFIPAGTGCVVYFGLAYAMGVPYVKLKGKRAGKRMKLNGNISASCIVLHENKVLLVRHTYGMAKNKYFVPGGNLKQGEMLEQTAVREVFEETCVQITITGILSIRIAPESAWFIFLADYISGTPASDNYENDSAVFMDVDEALSSESVSNTTKMFIEMAIDKNKRIFTLNDYVSTNNTDITRENWHLYN